MRSTAIADIADINPRLPAAARENGDLAVSFVAMADVSEAGFVSQFQERQLKDVMKGYTFFQRGDVLSAKITPCMQNGKAARTDSMLHEFGFGSTEFHVLRPGKEVAASYLFHMIWSKRYREAAESSFTGTGGQLRVPAEFFSRFIIPLPPLAEQQRIAAVLDQAEALRAKRRAALAKLDTLPQAIFVEMFGDSGENPKSWPVCSVGDYVAEFQGGKSIEAETGEGAVTRNRVLKVSAVTGMKFLPHESKPVPDSYEPPREHYVRSGDLLFSRANTTQLVGAVAYVEDAPPNLLLPDKLWRFVWRQPILVDPHFVWSLFQTPSLRFELGRRATGTSGSMKNISQEKVFGISTILPPLGLQRQFTERVAVIERLKAAHRSALTGLDTLFASLQHRAFRGEL